MKLKYLIKEISIWNDWRDSYKRYVPKFINEASTKANWEDWDSNTFNEFFEKSNNQCVSSLQNGYFSGNERAKIKKNWHELAPLFKLIADSQDIPLFDTYQKIKRVIRKYTSNDKRAATNRLIAGLQPNLLCTIVREEKLQHLFDFLVNNIVDFNESLGDWYKNSNAVLNFYKKQLSINNGYDIITLPWQTYEFISNENFNFEEMEKQQKIDEIIEPLLYKKQIILQGPPGTGKTKLAKEIAKKLIGQSNEKPISITNADIKRIVKQGQTISSVTDRVTYTVQEVTNNNVKLTGLNKSYSPSFSNISAWYQNKKWSIEGQQQHGLDPYEAAIAKYIYGEIEAIDNTYKYSKLIQFHPSYSYEDFVRGIVAKVSETGIIYKAENKILGDFAKRALENFNLSKEDNSLALKEMWIDDSFENFKDTIVQKILDGNDFILSGEITIFDNDDECFRYGKNWKIPSRINFLDFRNLINAKLENRLNLEQSLIPKKISVHAHYRSTYYIALLKKFFEEYNYIPQSEKIARQNYVLIIDEINRANLSSVLGELIYGLEYRGEKIESIYEVDGTNKLSLPPNLYIIGTMNTADRSIGHIDYAIRRRFAFIDVPAEDLYAELGTDFERDLFIKVSKLFSTNLSSEFIAKDVQLGHSYFIKQYEKDNDGNDEKDKPIDFSLRLKFEIKPILQEYVKDGILIGEIDGVSIDKYIKQL